MEKTGLPVEYRRLAERLDGLTATGWGWMARCPAHEDRKSSLSVRVRSDRVLLKCHAGCDTGAVVESLGLKWGDLFMGDRPKSRIVATYDYTDAAGQLQFQAVRFEPKGFCQRRHPRNDDPPDTIRNGWVWNLQGVSAVLYRLPEVLVAKTVVVVEGEKDADAVTALRIRGLAATCCPMGAGKWREQFSAALAGKRVIVIPDNDDPGQAHARTVAESVSEARILNLPGLKSGGDASDYLANHSREEFISELRSVRKESPNPSDIMGLVGVALSGCDESKAAGQELARILKSRGVL